MVSESILVIATTSLIVELAALALLVFGFSLKEKRNYRQHGITMTVAVGLHLTVILSWMVISLVNFFAAVTLDLTNALQLTTLVHVGSGVVAAALGVWLVGAWHLQANVQGCFRRKRLMLTTLVLWSIAVLLGTFFYYVVVTS